MLIESFHLLDFERYVARMRTSMAPGAKRAAHDIDRRGRALVDGRRIGKGDE
ncbi:MAG: hypothetical protein IH991_10785 [Planctomycetes bacterium]|nr:hypothetical protein [Planctomycetota bacterium]